MIMMLRKCFCGENPQEKRKAGAFVAFGDNDDDNDMLVKRNGTKTTGTNNDRYNATTNGTKQQQQQQQQQQQNGAQYMPSTYIPWVWSRTFHETYRIGEVLGKGSFAIVHEATQIAPPNTVYAVKIVQRDKLSRQDIASFKDEVLILSDLRHPNIIKLIELYKNPHWYFVVLEKLNGGELYDKLCQRKTYSEQDARNVCRILFETMAYVHAQKVAHRDLKPENLLLANANDDTHNIKIADFGFAKRVRKPNSLSTRCGSPLYTAPEIISGKKYDQRADNWSLGVIVYTLLGGYPPFFHQNSIHALFQQILTVNFTFHSEFWDGVSPDAKNLIKALLTLDTSKRATCESVLQQPWMTGRGDDLQNHSSSSNSLNRRNSDHTKCLTKNLHQFQKYNFERKQREAQVDKHVCAGHYWLLSRR